MEGFAGAATSSKNQAFCKEMECRTSFTRRDESQVSLGSTLSHKHAAVSTPLNVSLASKSSPLNTDKISNAISANQVTPFDSNPKTICGSIHNSNTAVHSHHLIDLNNDLTNPSGITLSSSKNVTHSVSRRGGRFVSPSHRHSACKTTSSGKSNDVDNILLSEKTNTTVNSGIEGSCCTVVEYKTYRSPTSYEEFNECPNHMSDHVGSDFGLSEGNESRNERSFPLDERKFNVMDKESDCTISSHSLNRLSVSTSHIPNENQDHDRGRLALSYILSATPAQGSDQLDHDDTNINEGTSTTEDNLAGKLTCDISRNSQGNDNELDHHTKNDVDCKTEPQVKVDRNQPKFMRSNLSDAMGATPCRSPIRDTLSALEDLKSPGGGGVFWLSPGPPTPKSPSKLTEREPYMATPTDFLFTNQNGKISSSTSAGTYSNINRSEMHRPTYDVHCPDTAGSFDTSSNVLSWLQSPNGIFSPGGLVPSVNNTPIHKTPRTPIVSTSFFFSDAAAFARSSTGSGGITAVESTPSKVTSTTYTTDGTNYRSEYWNRANRNSSVICVSPMLVNPKAHTFDAKLPDENDRFSKVPYANSLQNTPAAVTGSTPMIDLKNVFESPLEGKQVSKVMVRRLPLLLNDEEYDDDECDTNDKEINQSRRSLSSTHHPFPPRGILPQRSCSSGNSCDNATGTNHIDSVHRHLAERDLMEDEDLSVLLQLASNNSNTPRSSSIVFRSSPLLRQLSKNEDDIVNANDMENNDVTSKIQPPTASFMYQTSQRGDISLTARACKECTSSNPDFEPPLLMGTRSNSSNSKEMYACSQQLSQQDENDLNSSRHITVKKDSSNQNDGPANGKKPCSITPSAHMNHNGLLQNGTSSYPMHYPYSLAISHTPSTRSSSFGTPHLPLSMSGSMRVVVGGPPPDPSTSSSMTTSGSSSSGGGHSASTGLYGEYPGMTPYPPPYGQYSPPLNHHMLSSYTPYPSSHYPPPPQPHGTLNGTSRSTNQNVSQTASTTPKALKLSSNTTGKGLSDKGHWKNKASHEVGHDKKSKSSCNSKRAPQLLGHESKPSCFKKKKVSPICEGPDTTKSSAGMVNLDIVDTSINTKTSKKSKSKSPLSSNTFISSRIDRQIPSSSSAVAASVAAVNAAAGGKNAEAAALAAAILRGVTMRPSGKWQAQLYFAGKSRYIGVFDSREKAALAYEIAREKLKNGEGSANDKTSTENLVNAARKAAFDGIGGARIS